MFGNFQDCMSVSSSPKRSIKMAQSSEDEDENPENLLNEWLGELHILTEVSVNFFFFGCETPSFNVSIFLNTLRFHKLVQYAKLNVFLCQRRYHLTYFIFFEFLSKNYMTKRRNFSLCRHHIEILILLKF